MVKKHAAPRKASPKAAPAKKTKAKTVVAPKVHKPKGAPKEKLAYLNKAEMAALSKRNGGGPARGPKGIPSFVETSGTKSAKSISSSYKGGGGGWDSSKGSRSGNKSGVGGGGGGGGGATGSRGSSTGKVGARSGSEAPGNKGGSRSPMGGQGSSFSSPKAASDYNRKAVSGNANSGAPRGMMGTPRGYVNAAQAAAVDKAMAPVAAVGQQLPYFAPGVGPILGRAAGVVASAVPKVAGAIRGTVAARPAAATEKSIEAMNWAKRPNTKPMYTPQQTEKMVERLNTLDLARKRAAAQPGRLQRGVEAIDRGIDRVTDRMGLGTGDMARVKASGAIGGYGEGLRQGYDRYTGSSKPTETPKMSSQRTALGKGNRRDTNNVAGGKTNKGDYHGGGVARKTFKNK